MIASACGPPPRDPAKPPPGPVEPAVRQPIEAYFAAVDRADGAAICDTFTRALRRTVEQIQTVGCDKALAHEAKRLPDSLNGYEIVGATVGNDTAYVALDGGEFTDEMRLVREDGKWKIDAAPGLGR